MISRGATEAISPDLTQRLVARFPPGSSAAQLASFLRSQAFTNFNVCPNEPSIHSAQFSQSGGGLVGPYPATAQVAWKEGASGEVVWVKGFLAYTGP